MPTKIRLQRRGKKGKPYYHIVIADGRAPRDGKFIEKIGTYNPITTPAEIDLNLDRAVYWLQAGAHPSDTVKSILSYRGAIYKNHLLNGVRKGALTEEQVEIKFQAWLKEKQEKISSKIKDSVLAEKEEKKKLIEAEKQVNEARAKAIAEKRAAEGEVQRAEGEVQRAESEAQRAEGEAQSAEGEVQSAEGEVKEDKTEEPKAEDKEEGTEAEQEKKK